MNLKVKYISQVIISPIKNQANDLSKLSLYINAKKPSTDPIIIEKMIVKRKKPFFKLTINVANYD